ncbi:MAG: hypothetical protein MUF42_04445 [Cytophagaceae bacterium]|jgi:cell shape-determining protein MreC|nr:hypothetical protein [Cytophagaceae bacterium]
MKHTVLIVLLVIAAVLLLAILHWHPEWIQNAWLWVVGLFGTLTAFFKRLWSKFTGGSSIKSVESENESIKNQIKQLQDQIDVTNKRMEAEKQLYEKDIELLNQKIEVKRMEILLEEEKRKQLEKMKWEDYYNSLSDADKKRIQSDADDHTLDIN